jgi:cytochrome P450
VDRRAGGLRGGAPYRRGVVGDDITLDDLAIDPHPHLARLRARAPVAWVPAVGGWMVTGRAAAVEVLRDPVTFTVDDPRFSTARVVGPSMLSTDGVEHGRHRDPYVAEFRKRAVTSRFGPFVAASAAQLIDELGPASDLGPTLAAPLAAATVAETLGFDGRDRAAVERLIGWYREIVASVSGIAAGAAPTERGASAMAELGTAVRAAAAPPSGLSVQEAISDAAVIMFGGIETTEGMILNLLRHVLDDPAVRAAVAADPVRAEAAVEESLRLEPAAAVVDRYATQDVALGGATVRVGELVVVSIAGANRDPLEFPRPDRFDLDRPNARRHLAFAAGPHVCIGMDLARLEAVTALTMLLARRPGIRLAPGAPQPTGLVFRKPPALPVTIE